LIVYIESNFVIEIALGQEDAAAAETILRLAEVRQVTLAVPVFAVTEPFSTVAYRAVDRRRLCESLNSQLIQLRRSVPHEDAVSIVEPALSALLMIEKKEADLLEGTVGRLLEVAHVIPFDSASFAEATRYARVYGLSAQDATIYSSVIADLRRQDIAEPKCFISKNFKDFGSPEVKSELHSYSCRYITSFTDGLGYTRSR